MAQIAEDFQKAAAAYEELIGADPTPFIDAAYMTEEVSGIETNDEEKKKEHLEAIQDAAGLTGDEIRNGVEVFEQAHPTWRSEMVSIEFDLK